MDLYGLNDYPVRDTIQYGSIAVRGILIAAGGWIAWKGFGWLGIRSELAPREKVKS